MRPTWPLYRCRVDQRATTEFSPHTLDGRICATDMRLEASQVWEPDNLCYVGVHVILTGCVNSTYPFVASDGQRNIRMMLAPQTILQDAGGKLQY